jgi:hypothetical protein
MASEEQSLPDRIILINKNEWWSVEKLKLF